MKEKVLARMAFLFVYFVFFIYSIDFYYTPPDDIEKAIHGLSIFGWIAWGIVLVSWYFEKRRIVDLYTIFASFVLLFNYGQCLMWAFNIHQDYEIGRWPLYSVVYIDRVSIYKTQIITIAGFLSMHLGAILYKDKSSDIPVTGNNEKGYNASLNTVSDITLIVSALCTYYDAIRNIIVTANYGYGANLYNQDVVATQNNVIILISWMFVPSLIAQLLSSNYAPSTVKKCYTLFVIYVLLQVFGGDRGWLYTLLLFVWMHHVYYKRITSKQGIAMSIGLVIVLFLCVGLSSTRGNGISLESIMNEFKDNINPIPAAFFELGGSMKPAVVIVDKEPQYPYGNTYLLSFLGMVTERITTFLNPDYQGVGSWFSQTYLGIKYGAGFSIIAEAIINFGFTGAYIVLFVIGIIVSKITNICYLNKSNSIRSFICISVYSCMITMARGTLLTCLKHIVFSIIPIYVIMLILYQKEKERGTFKCSIE